MATRPGRRLSAPSGLRLALAVVVPALVVGLAMAPTASAQSICDQYPNLPECQDPDRDDDDDDDGDRRDGVGPGAGGPSAGAAEGKLPFTGYPLTPLLLLLLALLLTGLATRAYLAVRDRRGSHTPLQ